jgi:hypothetical protein
VQDPYPKILKQKTVGNMAQVAECLPSKQETLHSNPSTTKKKKKKNKKEN